jgi:proteic killer suppression protein
MIKTFSDRYTEELFTTRRCRRLPQEIQSTGLRALQRLDAARTLNDLRGVGRSLECLSDKTSEYAFRVNDKYRVRFTWRDGHAHSVKIEDYHRENRAG